MEQVAPSAGFRRQRIFEHNTHTEIDRETLDELEKSVCVLQAEIDDGKVVYGVNTGFGGSADTRTKNLDELQETITRELHCGILPSSTKTATSEDLGTHHSRSSHEFQVNSAEVTESSRCMPISWARASIIVRINSLAGNYSGVRPAILESLNELLKNGITPQIPLRGSISASGDLIPLLYIGGAIQGDPAIQVYKRTHRTGVYRMTTADVALREAFVTPLRYRPKEGLAIINGTAVSTGVAALAMHDANALAVLSQVLTAMSVEALRGTKDSFASIFARSRPHPGQHESAQNIYTFLSGSRMTRESADFGKRSLCQDRYSIRTAAQWIGPVLEDLQLANQQVTIECNSVTDNPLIDVESDQKSCNGGNFQARVITSAMEKTRSGLQTLGQMLFAQCTELLNPRMNFGLPPNLTADEPSESFLMKPIDIMIAALQSELGYLANSAGSHVQSAEMGNQALNSLALISARYTHSALDVLTQLASAHLLALCQAFDLRAIRIKFLESFKPVLKRDTEELFCYTISTPSDLSDLHTILWMEFQELLDQSTSMDSPARFKYVFRSLQPLILDAVRDRSEVLAQLRAWTTRCSENALVVFETSRNEFLINSDATPFLGAASRRIYSYIRRDLCVPFLRKNHLKSTKLEASVICQSSPEVTSNETESTALRPETLASKLINCDDRTQDASSEKESCDGMGASMQRDLSDCDQDQRSKEAPKTHNDMAASWEQLQHPECETKTSATSPSVGSYLSVIYEDLRRGAMYEPIFQCLEEAQV
ncbi:MAG: hypothetical protein OHK93_008017 [Ramalina farinacea]|uniref:Phenylalanine ammonia-lyase n=1 Tax=Ramalina farinacea TaxID=258253 RepID=A0AA43QPJ5_9LECA|nr:hypothetical protein [Ramalina farinacea]